MKIHVLHFMKPSAFLAQAETRERTKYRVHTALGIAILTVYGGIIAFALYVMSASIVPQSYGVSTVQAASTDATNSVTLTWTAPGDDSNTGKATSYDVRYSTSSLNSGTWGYATAVSNPPTPKTAGSSETLLVTGLQANTTYYFGLTTTDEVGNTSALSNIATKTTSAISVPACVESWSCGEWSTCTSGQQSRTCSDATSCGTTSNRPALSQTCGSGGTSNDTVSPNTALTSAPTAPITTSVYYFTWIGNDDQTGSSALRFSYQLDQRSWSGWTTNANVTLRNLLSGSHTFTVRSRDASGNIDPSPASVTFTVKLTPKVAVSQESGSSQITVLSATGKTLKTFNAFESTFKGGVQVQVGDLGNNGVNEIVVVPGSGRVGEVRIFRMDGTRIASYQPFGAKYKDGLTLALANVDGTGPARVIVAKQKGGANVRTFGYANGKNTQIYAEFNATTSNAKGGISLAAGDLNGDGRDEIITAPYSGASATISAYSLSGKRFTLLAQTKSVFAGTKLGVSVTTGDLKNTGSATVLAGLRTGNTTIKQLILSGKSLSIQKALLVPFASSDRNGVRLSTGDVNADGKLDIVVAHGAKVQTQLIVFNGTTLKKIITLNAYTKTTKAILSSDTGY